MAVFETLRWTCGCEECLVSLRKDIKYDAIKHVALGANEAVLDTAREDLKRVNKRLRMLRALKRQRRLRGCRGVV